MYTEAVERTFQEEGGGASEEGGGASEEGGGASEEGVLYCTVL